MLTGLLLCMSSSSNSVFMYLSPRVIVILSRHGRHTTSYMVINKKEVDNLLQDRKVTNAHRGMHIIVDCSVEEALGRAAFDTASGYISYVNDQGKDEMYIVQVWVDYSNLLDAVCTKTATVYRRGYSSVSWQMMSIYNLVDMEFYSPTICRVLALQPYKELTWQRGYMWQKQKAMDVFNHMDLPKDNKHHVLLEQCLQDHCGHAVKHCLASRTARTVPTVSLRTCGEVLQGQWRYSPREQTDRLHDYAQHQLGHDSRHNEGTSGASELPELRPRQAPTPGGLW